MALLLSEAGYQVHLAYVNHNLRGDESAREATWVISFAKQWGFPLEMLTLQAPDLHGGRGLQAQARCIRYAWMENLLNEKGLQWGATAHTLDDQMETYLYRFVRGGLLDDWRGIPFRRGRWLRPLLYTRRAELIDYLRERGAPYILDTTNYTPKYLRNRLRWWVIPVLRRLHPTLEEVWREKAYLAYLRRRHLNRLYQRWEARSFLPAPYGEKLIRGLPQDAFYEIIHRRWKVGSEDLRRLSLLWRKGHIGAQYESGDFLYIRTPEGIVRGAKVLWAPEWEALTINEDGGQYQWGLWRIEVARGKPATLNPGEYLLSWERDRLNFPLRVRLWRKGDRMSPQYLGGHSRKLSDIWPEVGFYGFERQHAFVVEDAKGIIIGAVGYRPSHDTAPVSQETFYLRARYGGSLSASSPSAQS